LCSWHEKLASQSLRAGDDPTGAALTGTAPRGLDVICLASLVLLEYDGCIGEVE
jgi:hypothetical protein